MQQQQQEAARPMQRGLHPWRRVILGLMIILILISLTVIGLLATGHLYDPAFVAPSATGLLIAIVAVLTWLFPLNAVDTQSPHQSSSAQTSAARTLASQADATPVQPVLPPPVLLPAQIFHPAQPLPAPEEFYGRAYERDTLRIRISNRSSTALVGEYRSGKSWLMQYVKQSASSHVRVGRLSATNPQCQTLAAFVQKALEVLQWHSQRSNLREAPLERLTIAAREMRNQGIIPVLCIDEFAYWIDNSDFDFKFLAGLRAIAEDEGLVLIAASREPLGAVIGQRMGASSPLFNIMPELTLPPFTEAEAGEFIDKKGQQSGLSVDEKSFFLDCASIRQAKGKKGWPPLLMQLTGDSLMKDKYGLAQNRYDLNDPVYRKAFKKRLNEQYWAMVKHP